MKRPQIVPDNKWYALALCCVLAASVLYLQGPAKTMLAADGATLRGKPIIKKDGKILLQKRQNAHGEGTWSLPGGHMEYGETPEQTAVREAKEEVNLNIKNTRMMGVTNDFMPEYKKHYITLYVEAEHVDGDPSIAEPDKITDIGWFSMNSLPSPLFIPFKNFIENKRLF